jgi:hypothetical protein
MSSTAALLDIPLGSTQVEPSRSPFASAPERLAGRATEQFRKHNPDPFLEPQNGADRRGERLEVLKDWEGVVDEVSADHFVARLLDRKGGSRIDTEAAKIPFSEVKEDDLPLIREGAIFYLTVYRVLTPPHGRTTRLYFRRLPAWTPSVLASAHSRAQRWKQRFGVAKSSASS